MSITIKEATDMLSKMPRKKLGFFPTPLCRLDALSEELGINLWIKRDDFTGSNLFGGNKTRKLEFLIGKAAEEGAECVFTYGATQSNHAMQTAWAAAKNGLKPILYLAAVVPPDPEDFKANLLLDGIFGAEIHVVDLEEGESFADAEKRSFKMGKEHIARLAEEGVKSYDIPMGGANKYGSLGYVNAMVEIAGQMESEGLHFDHMYHSTGSGGTMAGLVAGIEKYYEEVVRVKASSPKLAVCNTALMTAMLPYGFDELRSRHELWGHLFESAVGARLIPSCRGNDIQLRYWNIGNKEVDFVLSKGDRLVAMEVKTADADSVSGMKEFKTRYARAKPYLIGGQGMPPEMFFSCKVDSFL